MSCIAKSKLSIHEAAVLGVMLQLTACLGDASNDTTNNRVVDVSLSLDEQDAAVSDRSQGADQASDESVGQRMLKRSRACDRDPRVLLQLVSRETCIGADLFFRETFGGNGRTCGSCHPSAHNFTIDGDFIATLPADDPLFVSEQQEPLAELEIPELLRDFGLVRVNADGFEDPTHKFVMRSVPHTFSLATSIAPPPSVDGKVALDRTSLPPNHRTGWSGDGAPGNGELRDFTDGAVTQHATKSLARVAGSDFVLPTDAERDAITTFIELSTVHLSDPRAEQGRLSYVSGPGRECNDCHHNAGANTVVTDDETNESFLGNFSFDVGTERARVPALADFGVPFDAGFGVRPFDSDGDGIKDAFGNRAFNVPPLIEAADTGPFFHTHASATIEDAIRFYTTDTFGKSLSGAPSPSRPNGGPFVLSEDEIADLGRFLRAINASFNCQLVIARLQAALEINDAYGERFLAVQRGLLKAARSELQDASNDLSGAAALNPEVQSQLLEVRRELDLAIGPGSWSSLYRRLKTKSALARVSAANTALGSGMSFDIGEGTLMF